MNDKKPNAIVRVIGICIVIAIVIVGFKMYAQITDKQNNYKKQTVGQYIVENISFQDICDLYPKSEIDKYFQNHYKKEVVYVTSPDSKNIGDYSWFEMMDYGFKDKHGQTFYEYLDEVERQAKQDYQDRLEGGYWD